MLTLRERVGRYADAGYPAGSTYVVGGRIEGLWYVVRRPDKAVDYYGAYPGDYVRRIAALFPDVEDVLHLFSGKVEVGALSGVTFDISEEVGADVVGDVRELGRYFQPRSFDLVVADPPYEKKDFETYGCEPFDKREVVRNVAKLLRPGGFLVWLDLRIPAFSNELYRFVGVIAVVCGTNCRVRVVTILQTIGRIACQGLVNVKLFKEDA